MLSVTADTNIYVSGLNFGGNPRRLLNLAEARTIRLHSSDAIMAEVAKTLRGHKFAWPEEQIGKVLQELAWFTQRVTPTQTLSVITANPADNRILECAAAAGSDYLVTGDRKHLLPLGKYGKTRIVKVAEFLEILREPSGQQG